MNKSKDLLQTSQKRWRFLSLFLIVVVIILAVFVGVLASGALPAANQRLGLTSFSSRTDEASRTTLEVGQVWDASEESNAVQGSLSRDRSGSRLVWLSNTLDGVTVNFAECVKDRLRSVPSWQLKFQHYVQAVALDDSGSCLALLHPLGVDLYRFSEDSWTPEVTLTPPLEGEKWVTLCFDSFSRLLVTSRHPYGLRCFSFSSSSKTWLLASFVHMSKALKLWRRRHQLTWPRIQPLTSPAWEISTLSTSKANEALKNPNLTTLSPMFGDVLCSEREWVVCSDSLAAEQRGEVYVFRARPSLKGLFPNSSMPQEGQDDGELYELVQVLRGDPNLTSFGTQMCLNVLAKRLFVSYGPVANRVDFYLRGLDQSFGHVQTLFSGSSIPPSVQFPRFGAFMSCNESVLAVSCPGEEDDGFSSIFLYSFDGVTGKAVLLQQISTDHGLLGEALWVCPLKGKNLPFSRLTLIATDEKSGDYGRLLLWQDRSP